MFFLICHNWIAGLILEVKELPVWNPLHSYQLKITVFFFYHTCLLEYMWTNIKSHSKFFLICHHWIAGLFFWSKQTTNLQSTSLISTQNICLFLYIVCLLSYILTNSERPLTNKEECWASVNLFEIYGKKHDYYQNRKRFRVDMSEVDFTKVGRSLPNQSKLSSCIIQY